MDAGRSATGRPIFPHDFLCRRARFDQCPRTAPALHDRQLCRVRHIVVRPSPRSQNAQLVARIHITIRNSRFHARPVAGRILGRETNHPVIDRSRSHQKLRHEPATKDRGGPESRGNRKLGGMVASDHVSHADRSCGPTDGLTNNLRAHRGSRPHQRAFQPNAQTACVGRFGAGLTKPDFVRNPALILASLTPACTTLLTPATPLVRQFSRRALVQSNP